MYDINSNFIDEKNKKANSPIYLYTLEDVDGIGTDINLAEWDTDIVYDGVTYLKYAIRHDEVTENLSGEIDSFSVTIANASRFIQAYLEAYDLRGKKVTIKLVWLDQLADEDAHINFIYYINTYSSNQEAVEFTLSSKFDILQVSIPFGRYNRNYCRWRFKGTECGYAGAETVCTKTKQDCANNKNNIARYGGFPSIPSRALYVI